MERSWADTRNDPPGYAVQTLQPDVSFIHRFVVSQILTDAEAMEHVPTWMHDMPRPSGLHDMPHPPIHQS